VLAANTFCGDAKKQIPNNIKIPNAKKLKIELLELVIRL